MKGMSQAELKRFEELVRENEQMKQRIKELEAEIIRLKAKTEEK